MRVLMVMQHINFFRNLDTVVRELDTRGHEVVLLHGTRLDEKNTAKLAEKREKMVFMGRGIEVVQSDLPSVAVGYRPEPTEWWHKLLRHGRGVVNRGIYFRDDHPSPERVTESLERPLPKLVRRCLRLRPVQWILGRPAALAAWRRLEGLSPPSKTVVGLLRKIAPDVVLISPTIWPKRPVEADYMRAAQSLGLPTIGYLNSWDNLTSKGTVHVLPDVYMVWNEALADEAVEIHDIPRERIEITGAAHLDRFFALEPSATRAEICDRMGCPADVPYVVYLCSSRTLVASEVQVASDLADALATEFGDAAPTLVVRPHPTNPGPWDGFAHRGVVVYPRHGDQADSPESWQEYYDQLSQAACAFGLNTTAFLEAVAADRPCLTIVAHEFFPVQGRTGHFRHLLRGDFLEVSRDAAEVASRVRRVLDGADEKAAGRRFFTEWFLRPRGIDAPATAAVVAGIEAAAGAPASAPTANGHQRLVTIVEDPR